MTNKIELRLNKYNSIPILNGDFCGYVGQSNLLASWSQIRLVNLQGGVYYEYYNGACHHIASVGGVADYIYQYVIYTPGTYRIRYTVTGKAGGSISMRPCIAGIYGSLRNDPGVYEDYITITQADIDNTNGGHNVGMVNFGKTNGGFRAFRVDLITDNVVYPDLYSSIDIPLTYEFLSTDKLDENRGAYSSSFSIPATKHNNKIFEHLDLSSTNEFKFNDSNVCIIYQDDIQVLKGKFEVVKCLDSKGDIIEYEAQVFSDIPNLGESIGSKLIIGNDDTIDDINFSEYNHIFRRDLIAQSWSNVTGKGYVYPWADWTGKHDNNNWKVEDFRPCVFIKEVVDKIFFQNDFTYTSTFFDGSMFKNLVMPCCGILSPTREELDKRGLKRGVVNGAQVVTKYDVGYTGPYGLSEWCGWNASTANLRFNDLDQQLEFIDLYSQYDPTSTQIKIKKKGKYSIAASSSLKFHFWNRSTTKNLRWDSDESYYNVLGEIWRWDSQNGPNGTSVLLKSYTTVDLQLTSSATPPQSFSDPNYTGVNTVEVEDVQLNEGDFIYVYFQIQMKYKPITNSNYDDKFNIELTALKYQTDAYGSFDQSVAGTFIKIIALEGYICEGDDIDMQKVLPKNIKQIDFLNSVFKMFNLVIEEDKNKERNLLIETYDDYFASGTTEDWTSRIDVNEIKFGRVTDYINKNLYISYTPDTDSYNEVYKKSNNRVYGDKNLISDERYTEDEKFEIIFSPTVYTYSQGLKLSKFFKSDESGKIMDVEIRPRILNLIRIPYPLSSTLNFWSDNVPLVPYYTYNTSAQTFVSMGHFDNPFNPTFDLNFEKMRTYYDDTLGTDNNVFNKYWFERYYSLIDKDSRFVETTIKLSPMDIYNFSFNKNILIDNIWYHIHRIIEYLPDQLCKVELIKAFNKVTKRVKPIIPRPIYGGDISISNPVTPINGLDIWNTKPLTGVTISRDRNIINSSNVNIPYFNKLSIFGTDNINIPFIDGTIINNMLIKDGAASPFDILISGGRDEVQNLYGVNEINYISGGKDCVREAGSFKTHNIIKSL